MFPDTISAIGRSTRRWAANLEVLVVQTSRVLMVGCLVLAGCATTPEQEMARVGAPIVPDIELCTDRYVEYQAPRLTRDLAQTHRSGWVVVHFSLSPEGVAGGIRAESERASPDLVEAVVTAVTSSTFTRADAAQQCKLVFTFREMTG